MSIKIRPRNFISVRWREPYVWANVVRLHHGNLWWRLQVGRLEINWKRFGTPLRFI